MTKEALKNLLTRAAASTRSFALAIDTQLYKCGYTAEDERAAFDLAAALEGAVYDIEETFVEVTMEDDDETITKEHQLCQASP